ncbi:hypothetical protein [Lacipirellula limnantheis]|uniref:Uncharacterized protein n=1 Tax=Lacipirellula limnantheis TaxID=2528024 RepID=A0A517TXY0_9BACT|nr:hypothetical protein [Lacipirellula limnantheis]QDT73211.1 hypothetical protein I41_24000 [Lacipirellula limnantheis]
MIGWDPAAALLNHCRGGPNFYRHFLGVPRYLVILPHRPRFYGYCPGPPCLYFVVRGSAFFTSLPKGVSMAAGDMHKYMRTLAARHAAKGDQDFQEFREVYSQWTTDSRLEFRCAVLLIREANDMFASLPLREFRSPVESRTILRGEEGARCGDRSTALSARLLLMAMDAWDAGLDFAPPGLLYKT